MKARANLPIQYLNLKATSYSFPLDIPLDSLYNAEMESNAMASEELAELRVRPVERSEEAHSQEQMARHHYLGELPKIGETLWYVATWREQWVAQLSISAAALKCGVRDRWIGWDFRSQYGRLKLIANNSRFLILPDWHRPNVGSRVLALTERRIKVDWPARFGHALLLLETFVDPQRFHGGVYRASNWIELGLTLGYRRIRGGYSAEADAPKRVFVRALHRDARARLTHPDRERLQLAGCPSSCSTPNRCASCAVLAPALPDPAARKAAPSPARGAEHCGRGRSCVACADTRSSRNQPMPWARIKRAYVSAIGARTEVTSCPANSSFATVWCALNRAP